MPRLLRWRLPAMLEQNRAVWLSDAPRSDYPPLSRQVEVDVAVVGGGITGLSTALALQRAGMRVAVLESNRIGCGVTGASTAKVTSLHGKIYSQLEEKHDRHVARIYADANEYGLAQIAAFSEEAQALGFDCNFQRQPAVTYTLDARRVDELHEEAAAAVRARLDASFTTETQLPFPVAGAVRLDNQAQFQPYHYCLALAAAIANGGGPIFEMSRVLDVDGGSDEEPHLVQAHAADVRARHVVIATLLPFLDRGGFFARAHASRSYGIAVTLEGTAGEGMYIGIDAPVYSTRRIEGNRMIVVGQQHKVGQDEDTRRRYAALEQWTGERFSVVSVDHRWSAQDFISADSLPYIGPLPLGGGRLWTATGFNKWGLTTAAFAANILTDLIHGRDNPWAATFSATRGDVLASAKSMIGENLNVAKRFIGDRLRSLSGTDLHALKRGEGAIVSGNGERLAAYRDEAGAVHACSPICTHMGCYVQWNSAEKSWDCPCHGSRFDYQGQILQGPAVRPLEAKQVPGETNSTTPASDS
ncbi:MAG: FAD-dependent oxidoreductase [Pirellulales bacterium]